MDKKMLYRSIIVDNSTNPENKISEKPKGFIEIKTSSKTCADEFSIFLKINDKKIEQAFFKGEGCAISTAAINLICSYIENLSIKEAIAFITNYSNMIKNKDFDKELVQDLIALENVNVHLNRVQCALLGATSIQKKLEE